MKVKSLSILLLHAASNAVAFIPLRANAPTLHFHSDSVLNSSNDHRFYSVLSSAPQSNPRFKLLSTQLKATSISADAENEKSKSQSNPLFITSLISTLAIVSLDVSFRKLFKVLSISFPSSLAGCGALFTTLLGLYSIKPQWGDSLYGVLSPGAAVLAKWLPVFFVPSLVTLPLAPSFGSGMEVCLFSLLMNFNVTLHHLLLFPFRHRFSRCWE